MASTADEQVRFICLTGVDGSGKTTHIHGLLERLRGQGMKCTYVWLRRPYFFTLPILAYCRLVGLTRYEYVEGRRYGRWEFHRSRLISGLLPWVLLGDAALFALWKVYIPLWRGRTVVCDRFIYDTLVDLMVATRDFEVYRRTVGQLFLKLVPHRSRTMLLDAEVRVIRARKEDALHDPSIATRRKGYLALASHVSMPVVDTSQSVETTQVRILSLLSWYE